MRKCTFCRGSGVVHGEACVACAGRGASEAELASLRQALAASRAETREARAEWDRVKEELAEARKEIETRRSLTRGAIGAFTNEADDRRAAEADVGAARSRLETADELLYSWLRADCRRLNPNLALSTEAFLSPPPALSPEAEAAVAAISPAFLEAAMGETKPCDVPVCEWEAAYRQVIGLVRDWANEQVKEDGPDLTPAERKLILLVLSHDKDPRLPAAVIAVGMLDARSAASPAPGVPPEKEPTT